MQSRVADAGFLIALRRRDDQHHAWAAASARKNPPPWSTGEAVLSEAELLPGRAGCGSLRTAGRRGALRVVSVLPDDIGAVMDLLDKYNHVPMSLADACVVRITEVLSNPLTLTTDTGFKIYRRHSRKVVPCLLPPATEISRS